MSQIVADAMHIIGENQQNIYQKANYSGVNGLSPERGAGNISRLEFLISNQ